MDEVWGLKDARLIRLRGLAHILNAFQVAQRPQLVDTGIPSEAIRFRMTTQELPIEIHQDVA